ncbi:hypothetical protein ES707_12213 [subsurface metagenome]
MSMRRDLTYMIDAVNKTAEPFGEVENGIERLNAATARSSTLVFAEQRAQNFLIATYRQKYRSVYDSLSLMRDVGTIGSQVLSIVNAQNIAQIRLRDSIIDVDDAQRRMNTAIGLFGEDSVQYESALDDLEAANRRVEDAQDDAKMAMVGMGLQAVGVVGSIGSLVIKILEIPAAWSLLASLGPIALPVVLTVLAAATTQQAIEFLQTTAQEAARETAPGATAPGLPQGYIPDEYLDIGKTTGFSPIPAEMPFDPNAPDWAGGVMRPDITNVEINIEKVESSYDVDRLWDDLKRRMNQTEREDE